MSMPPAPRRPIAVGAALLSGNLLLCGCGSLGGDSGGRLSARSYLPQSYQDSKVITVGSDLTYAPMESEGPNGAVGFDPDLAEVLGKELGVTFKFENTSFDSLLPGLAAGKFDMVMSGMTDTLDRRLGGSKDGNPRFTFVDYYISGTSLLVRKGNPRRIQTVEDICGKRVAVQLETTQVDLLKQQADKCRLQGAPLPSAVQKENNQVTLDQVRVGNADVQMTDTPVALFSAQQNPRLYEVPNTLFDEAPYGIAVRKKDEKLAKALQEGINNLIIDGRYQQVVDKWNLAVGAIHSATLDGGF
ncbi:ABC transporter substrate-binding protein [Streptomyces sp. NPDC001380]|uniref:ABC transporter substrate-binding protein n=1 Tax=Streptomyces sp. NPDC001380 TaxID=3364566 RepID=UPI00369B0F31